MQDDGSLAGPRPVFARLGRRDVGRGEAVRDGWVRFKLADADYRQLAGEGSAIVTVDRATGHILGVKFLGRQSARFGLVWAMVRPASVGL
jgi:hypothetical protein